MTRRPLHRLFLAALFAVAAAPSWALGTPDCYSRDRLIADLEAKGYKAVFTFVDATMPGAIFLSPRGAAVVVTQPLPGVACVVVVVTNFQPYRPPAPADGPLDSPPAPGHGA